MGAFPSHDAPELLYTTLVTRPTTETRVEICLVPLLPRFFNDGHKKLKRKLSDLLMRKLSHLSPTASGVAAANSNTAGTPTAASGGNGSGSTTANAAKRQDQAGGTALVDYIMSCTESFFFVNTKVAVGKKDGAHDHQQQQKPHMKEKGGNTGSTSTSAANSGTETATSQQQQQHSGSHHASHHSTPSLMRPVPFAVCILEPDNSSTESNTSTSNQQNSSSKQQQQQQHQAQNNHTVLIKGRRLHLVGFVSCCMDRQMSQINTSNSPKLHALNGGGSNSGSSSSAPAGTMGASSSGDSKQPTYPVVLDVIFDDVEAHGYLTESVVLLASFAFRKQFVDSCALYFPVGDNDVEVAFDRQMERLQLRLVLRHDVYRDLRIFYSHYTLLDMIKELEMHKVPPTHFSLYENNYGEYGMEVTFSNKFLARWMRFVEKKMTVDSVNGYYVRCVTSDLLQERYRLMQERQDSGAFLEEEEDDERLFGGALLSVALKQWLVAGSQSLLHQQMQHPAAAPAMMFPGGPATAVPAGVGVGPAVPGGVGVGLGGFWPQMSMVLGAPPSWPAGVVPFNPAAAPMASVMNPPPSFVVPGGRHAHCALRRRALRRDGRRPAAAADCLRPARRAIGAGRSSTATSSSTSTAAGNSNSRSSSSNNNNNKHNRKHNHNNSYHSNSSGCWRRRASCCLSTNWHAAGVLCGASDVCGFVSAVHVSATTTATTTTAATATATATTAAAAAATIVLVIMREKEKERELYPHTERMR